MQVMVFRLVYAVSVTTTVNIRMLVLAPETLLFPRALSRALLFPPLLGVRDPRARFPTVVLSVLVTVLIPSRRLTASLCPMVPPVVLNPVIELVAQLSRLEGIPVSRLLTPLQLVDPQVSPVLVVLNVLPVLANLVTLILFLLVVVSPPSVPQVLEQVPQSVLAQQFPLPLPSPTLLMQLPTLAVWVLSPVIVVLTVVMCLVSLPMALDPHSALRFPMIGLEAALLPVVSSPESVLQSVAAHPDELIPLVLVIPVPSLMAEIRVLPVVPTVLTPRRPRLVLFPIPLSPVPVTVLARVPQSLAAHLSLPIPLTLVTALLSMAALGGAAACISVPLVVASVASVVVIELAALPISPVPVVPSVLEHVPYELVAQPVLMQPSLRVTRVPRVVMPISVAPVAAHLVAPAPNVVGPALLAVTRALSVPPVVPKVVQEPAAQLVLLTAVKSLTVTAVSLCRQTELPSVVRVLLMVPPRSVVLVADRPAALPSVLPILLSVLAHVANAIAAQKRLLPAMVLLMSPCSVVIVVVLVPARVVLTVSRMVSVVVLTEVPLISGSLHIVRVAVPVLLHVAPVPVA